MREPCVLVVDDDDGLRQLVRLTLEFAGITVYEAQDGLDALEKIHAELPALVLVDVMMPRVDGLTLCRTLRADPDTAHLPVIMISGKTDSRSIQEGLESSADEYITKPFEIKELTKRVKALLNGRLQQKTVFGGQQERIRVF